MTPNNNSSTKALDIPQKPVDPSKERWRNKGGKVDKIVKAKPEVEYFTSQGVRYAYTIDKLDDKNPMMARMSETGKPYIVKHGTGQAQVFHKPRKPRG